MSLDNDADNLDLANMPATFDYEGDETAWKQGLPPGEVGPKLSELELSESDNDSSVGSILGVCLDGFDGDAWMSDVEGAHDDTQVGEAACVNTWHSLAHHRLECWGKRCRVRHGGNKPGGVEGGITDSGGCASSVRGPLTGDEKKENKQLQDKTRKSPSGKNNQKNRLRVEDNADHRARRARQLQSISKLWEVIWMLTYGVGHTNINHFKLFDSPSHFLSEYIDMAYAEMMIRSVNP